MPGEPGLRRVGTFTAACVLVSNAVGSGIFTTTGFMARDLGDPGAILLVWGVGGLLALAGALSYAELGASLPRVGGEYVYVRRAFGPLAGFLSGWTSFTIGFSAAIAAASVAFGHYLVDLLPPAFPIRSPAVIALRRAEPDLPRPFRLALYPWVPVAFIAVSLWIAVYAARERPVEALLSVGTVAAGIPVYLVLASRSRS